MTAMAPREQLLELLLNPEQIYGEEYHDPHPSIERRYYDGGSEVDLDKLVDRIIEAGWTPPAPS